MAFTPEEKIRIELSSRAFSHYRRTNNWERAYRLAGLDLKRVVARQVKEVLEQLNDNEERFIKDEFIS